MLKLLSSIITLLFPVAMLLLAQVESFPKAAYADSEKQYRLKAAFVLNFLKFTTLPESSYDTDNNSFNICFFGNDAVAAGFESIENKAIGPLTIKVKHLESLESVSRCTLVFLPASEDSNLKQLVSILRGKGVLTIGESSEFSNNGGMITFFNDDGRMRFEINTVAAKKEQITFSSKLLKIAKIAYE